MLVYVLLVAVFFLSAIALQVTKQILKAEFEVREPVVPEKKSPKITPSPSDAVKFAARIARLEKDLLTEKSERAYLWFILQKYKKRITSVEQKLALPSFFDEKLEGESLPELFRER